MQKPTDRWISLEFNNRILIMHLCIIITCTLIARLALSYSIRQASRPFFSQVKKWCHRSFTQFSANRPKVWYLIGHMIWYGPYDIIWVILWNNYQKLKRTIHILKYVDWESNPKLLFQIIYDQTYNHDFTKLTIHKFNNRFCLTLTDCFSLLPPQSNFRTYYRTISSYYRSSLS